MFCLVFKRLIWLLCSIQDAFRFLFVADVWDVKGLPLLNKESFWWLSLDAMCWLVPLIIKAETKKGFLNQAVFTWQATQPLVACDSLLCRHWCPHLKHISSLSTRSPQEILSKNRSCSLKSTREVTFRSSDYGTLQRSAFACKQVDPINWRKYVHEAKYMLLSLQLL